MGNEAVGLLRELRRAPFIVYSLTLVVTAHALRGELDEARAGLAEIDAIDMLPRNVWAVETIQARAWTAMAADDLSTARRLLDEAVTLARSTGDRAGEVAALHDLARLGVARHIVARLTAAAADMEGELPAARAAHAAGLAGSDAPALEPVSATFEVMGAGLLAAEAAADAAVAYRRAGDRRKEHATYEKLGVDGRAELAQALQGY